MVERSVIDLYDAAWREGMAKGTATGLRAVCALDLVAMQIPEQEAILAPVLKRQNIWLLHGYRGSGKTQLATSTGLAAASGGSILGWKATRPHRTLIVDGEMPARAMQDRINGFMAGMGKQPEPGYLRIITPDLQDNAVGDLSTIEGQAMLDPHLAGVELLILDNLSTLCRSGIENDAESWAPMQEWLLSLRRRGLTTILVHHQGKGGQQRGTSKREDVLDVVIGLRRPDDYDPTQGARFEMHFEKARGLMGDAVQAIEASLHGGTDGSLAWTWRSLERSLIERAASLKTDGLTQREIATELGCSLGKVNKMHKGVA
jgi:putative DNA primase/helicase